MEDEVVIKREKYEYLLEREKALVEENKRLNKRVVELEVYATKLVVEEEDNG